MEQVKQIFPHFPDDRKVLRTQDFSRYYKINYTQRALYVPTQRAMHGNIRLLDTFIDAVQHFMLEDLEHPIDWSTVTYETDHGSEELAVVILDRLLRQTAEVAQKDGEACLLGSDIESRHLNFRGNKVLCLGMSFDGQHAGIVSAFTPRVVDKLHEVFEQNFISWDWHNGKFDTRLLKYIHKLKPRVDEDSMLYHYTCITETPGTHGLKDLSQVYLQAPAWDEVLDREKKRICAQRKLTLEQFTYDLFPTDMLERYLAFDACATRRLLPELRKIGRSEGEFIYRKLIKASNVYGTLEQNGFKVDLEYVDNLELELDQEHAAATIEVDKQVRRVWDPFQYVKDSGAKSTPKFFNMKSPQQLKWLLSKVSGVQLPNTRADTLDELFETMGEDNEVLHSIKILRSVNKNIDTYVTGIREALADDMRVHADYKLNGTRTGRLSCADPNMQNIPREKRIKNIFVAEQGKILVQLDYSQAELRSLQYLSKDKWLKQVYLDGRDLHDSVATDMFGPDFTKEQRVAAKTINFGIPYGRGAAALRDKFKMSIVDAQKMISDWFAVMPEVDAWIKEQKLMAVKGIVPTTLFGRQRHFIVTADNLWHVKNEYVNFPIQSLASDLTMFALMEIQDLIDYHDMGPKVKIIANVHDSIIFECDDDPNVVTWIVDNGTSIMKKVPIDNLPGLEIPFKADAEIGYKWGTLQSYEDYKNAIQ